jgi:uncharacterized protein (TIGR00159 family)
MELFKIGFVPVRLVDLLDMLLVGLLFYRLYQVFRSRLSLRTVVIAAGALLAWKGVQLLEFRLLGALLDIVVGLGALSLVVLFAPEIRQFLAQLGRETLLSRILRPAAGLQIQAAAVEEIVEALKSLRASGYGALIVVAGEDSLEEVEESGDLLNALISARLIYTIFHKESPLHDGAMVLSGNRIAAVRCILPLSKASNLSPELGLRHRSALGLAESSDALVIVVSEERRELSLAYRGELIRNVEYAEVEEAILRQSRQEAAAR